MDFDLVVKAIPAFFGVIGGLKALHEWVLTPRSRLREDYKFTKEVLQDLQQNTTLHPHARDKAYIALAGDATIEPHVVEYLVTLEDVHALQRYKTGRPYLTDQGTENGIEIVFKEKYRNPRALKIRRVIYGTLYAFSGLVSLSPLFVGPFADALFNVKLFKDSSQMWAALGITMLYGGPLAILSLRSLTRIYRAEALVKNQRRRTSLHRTDSPKLDSAAVVNPGKNCTDFAVLQWNSYSIGKLPQLPTQLIEAPAGGRAGDSNSAVERSQRSEASAQLARAGEPT
ncbi:hypothetical protein OOT46_22885 [Aquabacterium sp. A7-Y]|uniref:hypothetical protein n=1 Tax=Aquabacterium sp. A7-Y TaxID=1349605 RepID=UPI00223CEEF9|nr:hypothetical protein [Aquabacterium sp. A7-Y]MCW7540669.1 hypothetical protein [Aquabacterium sp. A7-Y]